MPLIIEMIPESALELQREIPNHPKLVAALSRLPQESDLEERFAMVLAYCGIKADGYFFEEDLIVLFELALDRLKKLSAVGIKIH